MYNKVADIYCKDPNLLLSVFNEMVESGMNEEEALSHLYAFCPTKRAALYLRSVLPISWNNILICPETRNSKDPSDSKEIEKYIKWIKTFDMKFDYVIQNPPYNGSLHLDFLEKGLDLLTEKGRMVIIEPATWLINVRKNGKAKKYDAIKKRIEGHVESVKIENFNKDFGVENNEPFAITTIDFSKTFDEIEFTCVGVTKKVKSIYDCNLIGNYDDVWALLNKVLGFGDMMKSHITKKPLADDVWYGKVSRVSRCGCKSGNRFHLDSYYYGDVFKYYYFNGFDDRDEISATYLKSRDSGNKLTDKDADFCLYGTKNELENWKHFIYTNKLSLFINLVMSINQDNNSKDFLPWLVDKQYTDEEINKLFGFTDKEIALIDRTIKKYERNSPWFKRYMCGPDSVSDEEVNNFIKNL